MKKLLFTIFVFVLIILPNGFSYAATPVKILIVPGHDNDYWGTEYHGLKEADMNLALATRIYNILKKDPRFQVYITRDWNGYTKTFEDYFTNHRDEIIKFKDDLKAETQKDTDNGVIIPKEDNVVHNSVNQEVAVRLYGINKWADENNMDAVIHVHFNDYPRPDTSMPGEYKGFVIYMPEHQVSNALESANLAQKIFTKLHSKYMTSTYQKEAGGLIEDQTLIALGSNLTLNSTVRALLIEYGYIYRFANKTMRFTAYDNFARLTATGIKDYFFPQTK